MWGSLVIGGILLGSYIYHRYIEDHPAGPKPQALQVPQVQEGVPIPLLYGTVRVRTPVMVWSNNYHVPGQAYDIVDDRGFSVGVAESENYSLDVLWVLGVPFYMHERPLIGLPPVRLLTVWSGDALFTSEINTTFIEKGSHVQKFTCIPNGVTGPNASVVTLTGAFYQGTSDQDLAAGFEQETPIDGKFLDGTVTLSRSYRGAVLNAFESPDLTPGYRNQVVVFAHVGLGLTSSISSFSFEVTSVAQFTESDFGHSGIDIFGVQLPRDEDPVAIMYDLLTSPWGKLSLPAEKVDRLSFQRASDILFAERHGYSMIVDQGRDASEIIDEILKQIDGVLYPEPTSGKLVLRLVRADYDVSTLRDINPTNARPADSTWYSIQSWSELPTQVRVTWTDRDSYYADAVAVAQNGAAAVAQGRTLRSVTIRYPGCCTRVLAQKLASRELAAVSIPVVKVSVIVDRSFHRTRPGDVFTLTWPELGIDRMVMRVARVDLGQLHDGKITLDMLRDAFDVSIGAFGSGSGSGSGSGIAI